MYGDRAHVISCQDSFCLSRNYLGGANQTNLDCHNALGYSTTGPLHWSRVALPILTYALRY